MKKTAFLLFALLISLSGLAQYKNDNVLFKTVYPQDLCSTLKEQPGYLLLDVRSKGEFEDTSSFGLNIGHLKDAINVDVRNLGRQISLMGAYKYKPVFVYCSHSQRSRRASKMLADSGFKQVFNINGGMTALHQFKLSDDCIRQLIQSPLPYSLLPTSALCDKLNSPGQSTVILDVRSDSAYRNITSNVEINSYGYLKNSVHIPLGELESRIGELPPGKEIVVIDLFADESPKAAALLVSKGFKSVSVLTDGLDKIVQADKAAMGCLADQYISPVKFQFMNAPELNDLMDAGSEMLILDIRSVDEFTNKHANYWQNIGNITGAVNIPVDSLLGKLPSLAKFRNKPVVVYTFSTNSKVFEAASLLTKNGFKKVNLLMGGIFNIRWTAANVKGREGLRNKVENVPAENL